MLSKPNRMVASPLTLVAIVLFSMVAALLPGSNARSADDYLEPEIAFKFSARMADPQTIEVKYLIAEGYYMYRERFDFIANGAQLGVPHIPAGKIKFDETFQKDVETYRKSVTIKLPVKTAGDFTLVATSQGCADKGLCYSPMESQIKLSPNGGSLLSAVQKLNNTAPSAALEVQPAYRNNGIVPIGNADSDMGRIERALKSGKLLVILPLFFLLGLGLAFTPCVLPMVPILSAIIVGEGTRSTRVRGFSLAAAYSSGMAIVYTALGIAAGLIGEGLSAALQNPWMLTSFAALMVALSLSMFGFYRFQMPAFAQSKLARMSEKQAAGKLVGVFAMGAISALIVGPCVAAPLAGALIYISQTRDVVIGGSALFVMATGMSVPLLLVGVSAGTLLPRAGIWMTAINRFFGVLLLGLALWMISPLIPASLLMSGWAMLGIGYGAYLLWPRKWNWFAHLLGLVFVSFGIVQVTGLVTGGRDVLAPLAHLGKDGNQKTEFVRVGSINELDLVLAQTKGKTVLLDFYADWCVSCVEMEKFTFTDVRVRSQLANIVLLQVDVTANNTDDKAMLKRFDLFGPPGIIFFDRQGREIEGGRVIGYQNVDKFLRSLAYVQQF